MTGEWFFFQNAETNVKVPMMTARDTFPFLVD